MSGGVLDGNDIHSGPIVLGLNAVILAVTEDAPRILTVRSRPPGQSEVGLPFGPLDPEGHPTLELALRCWVEEQSGLQLGYVEQLYTFGSRFRDPRERQGGPRVVSVAYLALTQESEPTHPETARWYSCYELLPWEDHRNGPPPLIEQTIYPALEAWAEAAPDDDTQKLRHERTDIAFGLNGAPWDGYRVLSRYELLYEVGLVTEARVDAALAGHENAAIGTIGASENCGLAMVLDHRRIVASALGRLRGKLQYRPVVFELLPESFTLFELQQVVEVLSGLPLHKQNFRRVVSQAGLVEETGEIDTHTGGRPAKLFRFRREVLRERPAPGVKLPVDRK